MWILGISELTNWLFVRKDIDINEHERLFNFAIQHKFKVKQTAHFQYV